MFLNREQTPQRFRTGPFAGSPCPVLWLCFNVDAGWTQRTRIPTEVPVHRYECGQIILMSSSDTPLFKESGSLIPRLIWYVETGDTLMDLYVYGGEGLRHESKALSNI